MNLADLVFKPALFITSIYLLMRVELIKTGLTKKLKKERKLYTAGGLGLLSLLFMYLFSGYKLEVYSLGIVMGGRILGFPYGLGIGAAVAGLGSVLLPGGVLLRPVLVGLIADSYHLNWLNKRTTIKQLIISLFLTAAVFATSGQYYLGLIHLLSFYSILWVINLYCNHRQLLEDKENKLETLGRARDSLQQLHSINQKMISNFDLDVTCEELIKISCEQLKVENGGLLLLNKEKGKLEMKTRYGLDKKYVRNFKLDSEQNYLCQVVADGEPFIVDDMQVRNYKSYSLFIEDGFRSLLLAPIIIEDKLAGLMFFVHQQAGFFSHEDLVPMQTIVKEVPLVIEQAEIFEKMERNVASLSMLQQASKIINSTLEQQEVFDLAVDVVMGTMGVSMSGLFLYQTEEEAVDLVSASGLPKNEERTKVVDKAEEVSLEIIKKGEPLIKDELGGEIREGFTSIDIRSAMVVPLQVREKTIGAIAVAQTEYKRRFTEADHRLITTLANQVAVAIENARMYNQMEKLATRDGLTKLYNHSIFQERLGEEIEAAQRYDRDLSLLMLDIDNFKEVNDNYGHQAGDQILKKLAQLLRREVRSSDIVARYGGEEFTVILPETSKREAQLIGQRLNEAIRKMKVDYNDWELSTTVSIGVAAYQARQSQEDFIDAVDQVLYQAKNNGKDCTCVAD